MPCHAILEPALSFCFAAEVLRGDLKQRAALTLRETGQLLDTRGVTLNTFLDELVSLLVDAAKRPPFHSPSATPVIVAAFAFYLNLREGEPHPFYRPQIKPPILSHLPLLDPFICGFSPVESDPFCLRPVRRNITPTKSISTDTSLSSSVQSTLNLRSEPTYASSLEALRRLLQGSTWMGYYALKGALSNMDPPMKDVQLTLCIDPDPDPVSAREAVYEVAGHGDDAVGHFRLVGQIAAADNLRLGAGKPFIFRKHYVNAHSWIWEGFLTQFGFAGIWRSIGGGPRDVHGVFWLWRSDWQSSPPRDGKNLDEG